jgi:hypothetical protein
LALQDLAAGDRIVPAIGGIDESVQDTRAAFSGASGIFPCQENIFQRLYGKKLIDSVGYPIYAIAIMYDPFGRMGYYAQDNERLHYYFRPPDPPNIDWVPPLGEIPYNPLDPFEYPPDDPEPRFPKPRFQRPRKAPEDYLVGTRLFQGEYTIEVGPTPGVHQPSAYVPVNGSPSLTEVFPTPPGTSLSAGQSIGSHHQFLPGGYDLELQIGSGYSVIATFDFTALAGGVFDLLTLEGEMSVSAGDWEAPAIVTPVQRDISDLIGIIGDVEIGMPAVGALAASPDTGSGFFWASSGGIIFTKLHIGRVDEETEA